MKYIKSFFSYVYEVLAEAKKARADAIVRRIGR
jgi:hypothetical protein